MKKLLVGLLALCLLLGRGVGADNEKSYLAVFCNPDFEKEWSFIHPDYLCTAFNWAQLDDFLQSTKRNAHGRPIEIDFDCHGAPGGLYLKYPSQYHGDHYETHLASMGYICNHIDKYFNSKKITVIIEACYSGRVYQETIRNNAGVTDVPDSLTEITTERCIEDHLGIPQYPIYGVGLNIPGIDNFVYLEYITKIRPYFMDLREIETMKDQIQPATEELQEAAVMDERLFEKFIAQYIVLQ